MADPVAPFPAHLLSYLGLIGVVAARRVPNILAALILVLQVAVQDLVEDLRRYLEANWTDIVRFATGRKDIEYYEMELASGRLNDLLIEAACRMNNIQLLVRHLEAPANHSRLYGTHGPLHEIVEVAGQWFALQQPIAPWSENAAMKVAQEEQSQYWMDEGLEPADIAGPSHVRSSSRRSRKTTGSIKRKTPKKTSRTEHLKLEVVCSPVPSYVRPVLTATRRAAKRLSDQARRTLLGRVRFNPLATVIDISPLADKVPNETRLPEDTVRQDDGDALEMVREGETEEGGRMEEGEEEREEMAAQEDQAAEEVGGNEGEEDDAAEQPQVEEAVGGEEHIEEEAVEPAVDIGEQEDVAVDAEAVDEEEAVASVGEADDRAPADEVIELQGPAYERQNNAYVCRLPGCPTPGKEFRTIKGWKLHASLTRAHQKQGFCTGCSHYVVMPPQLDDSEKKIWLDSHRKERCEGASKAILKQRRLEKRRLEALWRDASHVKLPEDDEAEVRRPPKRAYPTEDERRAGVCLAYIKHFKMTNPARLDEVAADFQLTIS